MKRLALALVVIACFGTLGTAHAADSSHSAATGATKSDVVIGIPRSFGPGSVGWGTVEPNELFNGGDPSGDILRIHWSAWGGTVAVGAGKNAIFKPNGGYYAKPVTIQLRAKDRGKCGPSGLIGYHHLYFRSPSKPGGKLGKWHIWTSYHRNLCTKFK